MPTIWDIDELRPLEGIGQRHGLAFTLRGGAAFRLALRLNSAGELDNSPISLFELARFTADIDLVHTGQPETTGELLDAILSEVPSAECFRWELRSESEDRIYQDQLARGNFVPARLIRVGEDPVKGLIDPANGRADIQTREFRYHRNPLFRLSPLFLAGRDLEIFSALLYMQTLFEAGVTELDRAQPGWQAAQAVFRDASSDREVRRQLEQHAYLRCRLRYLLVNTVAAHPSRVVFQRVAEAIGLRGFIAAVAGASRPVQLNQDLLRFLTTDETKSFVLVSSARLGGDTLRLPLTTDEWLFASSLGTTAPSYVPRLGPNQQLALVSPELEIEPGSSASSRAAPSGPQEFVCFELSFTPLSPASEVEPRPRTASQPTAGRDMPRLDLYRINNEDLSGFLTFRKAGSKEWLPLALPNVVEQRRWSHDRDYRIAIRINCLGLIEALAPSAACVGLVARNQGRDELA
jgi:hypothetical protein